MKWTPRNYRSVLPVLLLALATSTAWGASYRWTDAAGNVHYGDQPPTGVEAERMYAPPPPPLGSGDTPQHAAPEGSPGVTEVTPGTTAQPDNAASGASETSPSEEALKRDQQRKAQEARQNADIKRRNCQSARNNLEVLQRNKPFRIQDEGSSKRRGRRVSTEERAQMTREAQKQIRENCN
jgi:hypothetical protein